MTKTTENTDPGEVERLRNHNAELLAELKTAKAKVTALQGQLTTATEERDASRAEVLTVRLDGPVRSMLEGIAVPGTAEVLAQMIATRGYAFDLDGEQIAIRDASGNPATSLTGAAGTWPHPSRAPLSSTGAT